MRRYFEGADLSKALPIPAWLDALLSHDHVAYPIHAAAGSLLNRLHAPASVAGLEWLKAAAHARSEPALTRVVVGLTIATGRAAANDLAPLLHGAVVRRVTRRGRDVRMRRRQLIALQRAGLGSAGAHGGATGSADGRGHDR